jgi:hypothetical protein
MGTTIWTGQSGISQRSDRRFAGITTSGAPVGRSMTQKYTLTFYLDSHGFSFWKQGESEKLREQLDGRVKESLETSAQLAPEDTAR